MSEVVTEASQESRYPHLGENLLRGATGLGILSLSTVIGYRIGTDAIAPSTPEFPAWVSTAFGTGVGVVMGTFGGFYIATMGNNGGQNVQRMMGPPGKEAEPKREPRKPRSVEAPAYDPAEFAHMMPNVSAAEGIYDDDPALRTLEQLEAEQL